MIKIQDNPFKDISVSQTVSDRVVHLIKGNIYGNKNYNQFVKDAQKNNQQLYESEILLLYPTNRKLKIPSIRWMGIYPTEKELSDIFTVQVNTKPYYKEANIVYWIIYPE